jgi:hypothetical protein
MGGKKGSERNCFFRNDDVVVEAAARGPLIDAGPNIVDVGYGAAMDFWYLGELGFEQSQSLGLKFTLPGGVSTGKSPE